MHSSADRRRLTAALATVGALWAALVIVASPGAPASANLTVAPYQTLSQESPIPFPATDPACPAHVRSSMSTSASACARPDRAATADPAAVTPTTVPGALGAAAILPVDEGQGVPPGAYALIHQYGDVSLMAGDGSRVWNRPSISFEEDWFDDASGEGSYVNPRVPTGFDPFDPFDRVSNRVYALGTLTGSGSPFLAVAHDVRYIAPGTGFREATFVTVMNVITGKTVWSASYAGYVTQLLISDGVLVVGEETGDPSRPGARGEDGARTRLHGLTFRPDARGTLEARTAWSYSTDAPWARWLAAEPAGSGGIAAAWTSTSPGSGGDEYGHILFLDVDTGTVNWSTTTPTYPRLLRHDAGRDAIVWIGQTDPTTAWSYTLEALGVADGAPLGEQVTRSSAQPFALEVADVDGDGDSEWVTSDVTMSSATPVTGSSPSGARVIAVGGDGTTLWETTASDSPTAYPYGLAVQHVDGSAVVLVSSYFSLTEPTPWLTRYSGNSELRALAGATGQRLWGRGGNDGSDVLTPLALTPYEVDGQPAVLTATSASLAVHAYALADGSMLRRTPLLGTVTALDAVDVNRDGVTDLVVGGESEAVFALDGRTLGANPTKLWATRVDGAVHDIHAVSLPNGERRLVVAAATSRVTGPNRGNAYPTPVRSAVDVLDTETGARQFRIATLPDYAWSAVVVDAKPGEEPSVIVPTSSLTAYRISDGTQLWRFAPLPVSIPGQTEGGSSSLYFSRPAVTADGANVAVQYWLNRVGTPYTCLSNPAPPPDAACVPDAYPTVTPDNFTNAVLDVSTGQPVWQQPHVSPGWPDAEGVAVGVPTAAGEPGVAFTHTNFVWPAGPSQVQIDVYDLDSGTLSYTALPSSRFGGQTAVLPINGLVSHGFIHVTSISPEGNVERRVGGFASTLAEGRAGLGDFLVDEGFLPQTAYIYDARPAGETYTLLATGQNASKYNGPLGGRLLIRDLDGDGGDEIIESSYDWSAANAVANQMGAFSYGSVYNAPRAIQIYRLD